MEHIVIHNYPHTPLKTVFFLKTTHSRKIERVFFNTYADIQGRLLPP